MSSATSLFLPIAQFAALISAAQPATSALRPWFLVLLFILGACLGSFLCCQARRLHLRELATSGKVGNRSPRKPHSRASSSRKSQLNSPHRPTAADLGPRSVCLSCGAQLKWYDNLPLLSWLFLRGRCRHCHAKIGLLEPLSELGLALAFLLLGVAFTSPNLLPAAFVLPTTPSPTFLPWALFLLSLVFACLLGFLAIYDGAYGELPTSLLTISTICAIIIATLKAWASFLVSGWTPALILEPLASVAILGGTYLALYLISKGKWVGDGDWLLGLALGLALGHPWLALLTLGLANLLACLITLPLLFTSSRKSGARNVHLGPFLVTAFLLIYCCQNFFLNLLQL